MDDLAKKQRVLFVTGENRLGNCLASLLTNHEICLEMVTGLCKNIDVNTPVKLIPC